MQCWSGYILIGVVDVMVYCYVTTLTSQSQSSPICHLGTLQTSLQWEALGAPTFCHFLERDPDFANLQRKGSQILTILTRTSVADENLKISIPIMWWFLNGPLSCVPLCCKTPCLIYLGQNQSLWGVFTWLKYNITHCVWYVSMLQPIG